MLGRSHFVFIDPGVKIIGAYYRDVLLAQHLLPFISSNVCWMYGRNEVRINERPNMNDQASNTIKDLLKFAIVRNSHFKHSYLFIYKIKCYGTLESSCWFNSLNIWKVLV